MRSPAVQRRSCAPHTTLQHPHTHSYRLLVQLTSDFGKTPLPQDNSHCFSYTVLTSTPSSFNWFYSSEWYSSDPVSRSGWGLTEETHRTTAWSSSAGKERGERSRDRAGRGGWVWVGAVYFGTSSVSAGKRDARLVYRGKGGARPRGGHSHNWWSPTGDMKIRGRFMRCYAHTGPHLHINLKQSRRNVYYLHLLIKI